MLVRRLDAIILTANDLPTIAVDDFPANVPFRGASKEPPVVDAFIHSWDGTQPEEHITVRYWLFQSVADAQKATDQWRSILSSLAIVINGKIESVYQPEPNAEDVIGDATWRSANSAFLWFVKNNVLVYIMARRPLVNQLTFTRSVARKIEAKINAVLEKK